MPSSLGVNVGAAAEVFELAVRGEGPAVAPVPLENHWVSVTVDPADPNVFTFHQHIVPANVPTYTPPSP